MADETLENVGAAAGRTGQGQLAARDLEAVWTALAAQILQLGTEIRAGFSALREEIRTTNEETLRVFREEMRGVNEETRRYNRVLHADLIGRVERRRG